MDDVKLKSTSIVVLPPNYISDFLNGVLCPLIHHFQKGGHTYILYSLKKISKNETHIILEFYGNESHRFQWIFCLTTLYERFELKINGIEDFYLEKIELELINLPLHRGARHEGP